MHARSVTDLPVPAAPVMNTDLPLSTSCTHTLLCAAPESTRGHYAARARAGFVPCAACGTFVRAANDGLEWHMKDAHAAPTHAAAHAAAARAARALVVFRAPPRPPAAGLQPQTANQPPQPSLACMTGLR